MPATSKAGATRRKAGLPVDARALRALQEAGKDTPEERARAITLKVLSRQADIFNDVRATLLGAVPKVIGNIIGIAEGRAGRSSDQVAAAKLVLEWVRFPAAGGADIGAPGASLSEMPLEQLESALSGVLDRVRTLRAIDGQAQVIDASALSVPVIGTDGIEAPTAGTADGAQAQPSGATPPAPPASEPG